MTVKRTIFDVEYHEPGAEPREYRVRVIMSDRLMTETHGRKFGLMDAKEQPQLAGALWLYYASLREGHIGDDVKFSEFQERALDNMLVRDEPVDPTSESGDSSSDSRSDSPASTGPSESSQETTD